MNKQAPSHHAQEEGASPSSLSYVLAFDTANEQVALGLGVLNKEQKTIEVRAGIEIAAHRASNTTLLPRIDALLQEEGVAKEAIACVVCGRGPGSFTGVRIALATAKGIASAWEVPLLGVSTLDVVAWRIWRQGVRGNLLVLADAMRKEVYPVRYLLKQDGIVRRDADTVIKAEEASQRDDFFLPEKGGLTEDPLTSEVYLAGDALHKYASLFEMRGIVVDEALWNPTGEGLLLAAQAAWREGIVDPFEKSAGDPAVLLPVYTRLSDAEENERIRLSKNEPKNLHTGVQEEGVRRDQRAVARDTTLINARPDGQGIWYRPLDAAHVSALALLEKELMGVDAWSEALVLDELSRKDRVWWAAYGTEDESAVAEASFASEGIPAISVKEKEGTFLVGYAGGWIIDGQLQVLKVAVRPSFRRKGIAQTLLAYLASDARDLGAHECSLEVRAGNECAQALYESLALKQVGVRPRYYAEGEDAHIMTGPLPLPQGENDVAGMVLQVRSKAAEKVVDPLILAIETSCDETAAALIDGEGTLLSDTVASQIDFHARFGGVVPEIASRKHVEAIGGVSKECLEVAAARLNVPRLRWRDLSAVAATYTPGLVGALVVGVAFAKGAAWAADIPFIGVNHLEGHIYANKIETPDIVPPMVVSLVSGGHTMLVLAKDWGVYEILGTTLDDAVGEAFDKVAKVMGLGYPGGPAIARLAEEGNPAAIDFPRAMLHSGDLKFSLSGLKTAVITYIQAEEKAGRTLHKADIAASFQQAVIEVQVAKAQTALKQTGAKEFCLGGGVAANKALRKAYEVMCARQGVRLTVPPFSACTDNAGMIALVALDRYKKELFFGLDADAYAHADLSEPY